MDSLLSLIDALLQLGISLLDLLVALLQLARPWLPLLAWVAFWLFAPNWPRLRETLARGGWVGVALIGALAVLIWGSVAPGNGPVDFLGLKVSNFVEKTVYVSGLVCIMFLAGALQLSGCCAGCWQEADDNTAGAQQDHTAAHAGGHAGAQHAAAHH